MPETDFLTASKGSTHWHPESNVYPSEPADNKPLASEAPNCGTFCRHFRKLAQMSFNNFFPILPEPQTKNTSLHLCGGSDLFVFHTETRMSLHLFLPFLHLFLPSLPPSSFFLSFLPFFLPFLYSFLISFSSLLPNPQTFSITLTLVPSYCAHTISLQCHKIHTENHPS